MSQSEQTSTVEEPNPITMMANIEAAQLPDQTMEHHQHPTVEPHAMVLSQVEILDGLEHTDDETQLNQTSYTSVEKKSPLLIELKTFAEIEQITANARDPITIQHPDDNSAVAGTEQPIAVESSTDANRSSAVESSANTSVMRFKYSQIPPGFPLPNNHPLKLPNHYKIHQSSRPLHLNNHTQIFQNVRITICYRTGIIMIYAAEAAYYANNLFIYYIYDMLQTKSIDDNWCYTSQFTAYGKDLNQIEIEQYTCMHDMITELDLMNRTSQKIKSNLRTQIISVKSLNLVPSISYRLGEDGNTPIELPLMIDGIRQRLRNEFGSSDIQRPTADKPHQSTVDKPHQSAADNVDSSDTWHMIKTKARDFIDKTQEYQLWIGAAAVSIIIGAAVRRITRSNQ